MIRKAVMQNDVVAGWFDPQKAICFGDKSFTGDNKRHISKATGKEGDISQLYFSSQGNWIVMYGKLDCVSTEEYETHEFISEEEAVKWLIKNEYYEEELYNELMKNKKEFEEAEKEFPDFPMEAYYRILSKISSSEL